MNVSPTLVNRILIQRILEHPLDFAWNVQGLGMMRLYIRKPDLRLHIWDQLLKISGASPMHTHPWNFSSQVVAGVVRNIRFVPTDNNGEFFNCVEITCGAEACTHGEVKEVQLIERIPERYVTGQEYFQSFDEIHYSFPEDGTVTLVERFVPEGHLPDRANVYWRGKGGYTDATVHEATGEEIMRVTKKALETWF